MCVSTVAHAGILRRRASSLSPIFSASVLSFHSVLSPHSSVLFSGRHRFTAPYHSPATTKPCHPPPPRGLRCFVRSAAQRRARGGLVHGRATIGRAGIAAPARRHDRV